MDIWGENPIHLMFKDFKPKLESFLNNKVTSLFGAEGKEQIRDEAKQILDSQICKASCTNLRLGLSNLT